MRIRKFKLIWFVYLFIFSSALGDEVTFKIGNVKYDYTDLELTYTGRDATGTFSVGKFSFSTMDSGFEFNDFNENARLDVGPSKLVLQNLKLNFLENYTRNNIEFDLGTLRFDITECDFDVIRGEQPSINSFNAKFSTNNINLDLSNVSNFPPEIDAFLQQIGMPINKISITRANINTSYNNRNLFKFDLNGITSLANFNIDIQATINEQYPEKSNYQAFKLTISNLSKESQAMLALMQAQSGVVIPMQNGSITFDIKDMLNMGQNPFQ
tara:strand:+ start:264 stop:1070 length:807 start_codon:yes stop_codon:yes gene_type:complete